MVSSRRARIGSAAIRTGAGALSRLAAPALAGILWAGTAACASSGAVPRPFPGPSETESAPPVSVAPRPEAAAPESGPAFSAGYAVAGTALGLRGAPYRDGGHDPTGFDCSGFIWFVFAQHGFALPRTVTELFGSGQPVGVDELQPGDLVFFSTVAPGASHVGMSIGGDQFVHAPSSKGEVRIERVTTPYWRSRFVGARRVIVIADGSAAAATLRDARLSASTGAWSTR